MDTTSAKGFDLDVTVDADRSHWPELLAALENLGHRLSWTTTTHSHVQLVAEEWALNVMMHGSGPQGAQSWLRIAVLDAPKTVTMQFTDNGLPFNPLAQGDKVLPDSLEDAQIGGLGLHLIRQMASSIGYSREGDFNCLRVELTKSATHM